MDFFTREELERYDRQVKLSGFGIEKQAKLKQSAALVVGVGGLGSLALYYLAAAGVGRILLVDKERVELSNLNRQIIHWTKDVGRPKVESAAEKLRELNPDVKVEPLHAPASGEVLEELVKEVDVVVDCLDNYSTRFLLNEVCLRHGKPLVHGAVYGMEGRATTIIPGRTPCLRCIIPKNPPEQKGFPVLGPAVGVIASVEALEAIKLLTGVGELLAGRLLVFDGESMSFEIVQVRRNPNCPACGKLAP